MSLHTRTAQYQRTAIGLLVLLLSSLLDAADVVTTRKGELSSAGVHVTVQLDALARDQSGIELPIADKRVAIGNIPFDLVSRPDADNLFLKSAEWPDWKTDPSSYYSAYDKGPETPGDPRRLGKFQYEPIAELDGEKEGRKGTSLRPAFWPRKHVESSGQHRRWQRRPR